MRRMNIQPVCREQRVKRLIKFIDFMLHAFVALFPFVPWSVRCLFGGWWQFVPTPRLFCFYILMRFQHSDNSKYKLVIPWKTISNVRCLKILSDLLFINDSFSFENHFISTQETTVVNQPSIPIQAV